MLVGKNSHSIWVLEAKGMSAKKGKLIKKKRRDKKCINRLCTDSCVKCKWKTFAGEVVPCYDRKEQQWKRLSFHPNQISFSDGGSFASYCL
ncbi:hypothetical protein CEXT_159361 [Caerostris extrusa]|uniref:Uncharacterized protein n=1 Tax=Caerostris extrusa TaxID=172846 RepID=A0AAV4SYX4_CAEEX|nr:hypothetical protein CEXT_159361 [Caerostris extrusa]